MESHVSAILLAAGSSRRMGTCKQLLPLDGRPAILRCLETALAAGIGDIVVVVGPEGDAVADAVAGAISRLPVRIARNDDRESDMAGSVRVGLREVSREATGVLVFLADHPLVAAGTVSRLVNRHSRDPGSILIPTHQGKKGHPTLFPAAVIREITVLKTLRDIVGKESGRVRHVEVPDAGVTLDMDTREDYEKLAAMAGPGSAV